jgi:hypothetical protein
MSIKIAPCILPNLHIELEADGPEGDEHLWLRGSFHMWGAIFFIECYRVTVVNDGTSTYQQLDRQPKKGFNYGDWLVDFQRLETAHAPDGGFQTVNIDGADYAVFIYPASDS